MVLAPGASTEDGLLQPHEIAALDLEGRLVVLSACHSAAGDVLRGEGVMSLARAFFEARAHAVVGSLWPLRDDEAEDLFARFYSQLDNGQSVASALARAQRQSIAAGVDAAAWAGVTVLGDGSLVPLEDHGGPTRFAAWGLGVLLVVAAGIFAASWWRRREALSHP